MLALSKLVVFMQVFFVSLIIASLPVTGFLMWLRKRKSENN
jgi:hypothetical protein